MTLPRKPFRGAEAKLRFIEEKLRAGTWILDIETSEVTWSEGLFRLIGLDQNTVVPSLDLLNSLIHPDDRITYGSQSELVADLRLRDRRFRLIRPDGRLLHVHSQAEPHFDRNGHMTLLFGTTVDITATEQSRSSLHAHQQVAAILNQIASSHVWRADKNGVLKNFEHWSRLTGQTAEEARDWSRLDAIHPEDRGEFRAAWKKAIDGASEFRATLRVRLKDGKYSTVDGCALPIRGETGEILEWVGFSQIIGPSSTADSDIHPAQIRAARSLLDWSGLELAERSGISFSTLHRMEKSVDSVQVDKIAKVRKTLSEHGIFFHDDGGGRLGVSFTAG